MTMRKNAKSKKAPRITRSTPFTHVWQSGRFIKTYLHGQQVVSTIHDTIHINSTK